MDQSNP